MQTSSSKFFFLPRQNLYFQHFLDGEMSLEEDEKKGFKDYAVLKVLSMKKSENEYIV